MPDITHEQAKKWIQAAVDGGLPASSRKALEAHLAGCADCVEYARDIAAMDTRLRRVIQARAEIRRDLVTVPLQIYSQFRSKTMHKQVMNNLKYYVLVPLLLLVMVGLFYRFLPGWIGQKQTGVGAGAKTPSLEIMQLMTIAPPIGKTPVLSAPNSPTVIPRSISVDTITVNFYPGYQNYDLFIALENLVTQFNQAHPDILVKISTDQNENHDCLIEAISPYYAGTLGNIQVISLNTLFEGESESFQQDYDPALLAFSRYQGELYVLPVTTQPIFMFYNADLLARRGLQPPSDGWTFDDFLNMIQKVASTSETDKSYGYFNGDLNLLLAARNVQWLDTTGDLMTVKYYTPEMVSALTWMAGLIKSGAVYYDISEDRSPGMESAFGSGQLAFWTSQSGWTDASGFITPNNRPSFKVGIAPLPLMPVTSARISMSYDVGFYITKQAKNPQACWTWMKYLSQQPTVFPGIPARKSVAALPAWEASVGKDLAAVYRLSETRVKREVADALKSNIDFIFTLPVYEWKWQAANAIYKGGDPIMALIEAQRKADEYLVCMQGVDMTKLSDITAKEKICASQVDPQGNW